MGERACTGENIPRRPLYSWKKVEKERKSSTSPHIVTFAFVSSRKYLGPCSRFMITLYLFFPPSPYTRISLSAFYTSLQANLQPVISLNCCVFPCCSRDMPFIVDEGRGGAAQRRRVEKKRKESANVMKTRVHATIHFRSVSLI